VAYVAFEGLTAFLGQGIFGPRDAPGKALGAFDVAGFFQLAGVDAEIAVGDVEQPLEFGEALRASAGQSG
jgi:hypothetical protein